MPRFRAVLAASLLAAVCLPAGVAAAGERYSDPDFHYSIPVPEGWVRIPDSELRIRTARMGEKHSPYAAAFQRDRSPWFTRPYLLVANEALSTAEIEKRVEEFRGGRDLGRSLTLAAGDRPVVYGKSRWDEEHLLVRVTAREGLMTMEVVKSEILQCFGKPGLVRLDFQTLEKDWGRDRDALQAVVDGFEFEPEWSLRPPPPPPEPPPPPPAPPPAPEPLPPPAPPPADPFAQIAPFLIALLLLVFVAAAAMLIGRRNQDRRRRPVRRRRR